MVATTTASITASAPSIGRMGPSFSSGIEGARSVSGPATFSGLNRISPESRTSANVLSMPRYTVGESRLGQMGSTDRSVTSLPGFRSSVSSLETQARAMSLMFIGTAQRIGEIRSGQLAEARANTAVVNSAILFGISKLPEVKVNAIVPFNPAAVVSLEQVAAEVAAPRFRQSPGSPSEKNQLLAKEAVATVKRAAGKGLIAELGRRSHQEQQAQAVLKAENLILEVKASARKGLVRALANIRQEAEVLAPEPSKSVDLLVIPEAVKANPIPTESQPIKGSIDFARGSSRSYRTPDIPDRPSLAPQVRFNEFSKVIPINPNQEKPDNLKLVLGPEVPDSKPALKVKTDQVKPDAKLATQTRPQAEATLGEVYQPLVEMGLLGAKEAQVLVRNFPVVREQAEVGELVAAAQGGGKGVKTRVSWGLIEFFGREKRQKIVRDKAAEKARQNAIFQAGKEMAKLNEQGELVVDGIEMVAWLRATDPAHPERLSGLVRKEASAQDGLYEAIKESLRDIERGKVEQVVHMGQVKASQAEAAMVAFEGTAVKPETPGLILNPHWRRLRLMLVEAILGLSKDVVKESVKASI